MKTCKKGIYVILMTLLFLSFIFFNYSSLHSNCGLLNIRNNRTRDFLGIKGLQKEWHVNWSTTDQELGYGISIGDGIYVSGGKVFPNEDIVAIGYAMNGTEIWNDTLDSGGQDLSMDLVVSNDNKFLYLATYNTSDYVNYDARLIKYNASSGNLIWNNVTMRNVSMGFGVAITSDNQHIYLTGGTPSGVLLSSFDTSGNLEWNKTWPGNLLYGVDMKLTSDEEYFYVVAQNSTPTPTYSHLIKFNSTNGNYIWNSTMINSSYDLLLEDLIIDPNTNDIYVIGYIGNSLGGPCDIFLARYNDTGEQIWNKTINLSYDDAGYGITMYSNYIYVVGYSNVTNTPEPIIIKTDLDGNIIGYNTSGFKGLARNVEIKNNEFYICGQMYVALDIDIFLLKYTDIEEAPESFPLLLVLLSQKGDSSVDSIYGLAILGGIIAIPVIIGIIIKKSKD